MGSKKKVNLLNLGSVKTALDETVKEITKRDVAKEDTSLIIIEVLINICVCGLAVYAYFYPFPKAGSRAVLGACCAIYWIVMGITYVISHYIVGDCLLITQPFSNGKALRINSKLDVEKKGANTLAVPQYTLTVHLINIKQSGLLTKYSHKYHSPASLTFLITDFFDEDGILNVKTLDVVVADLLKNAKQLKTE